MAAEPGRYVVAVERSGAVRWVRPADRDAALLVAGSDGSYLLVGGAPCGDLGSRRAVVSRFDLEGALRWSRGFSGRVCGWDQGSVYIESAALAPDGAVLISGSFSGEVDLGLGPVRAPEGRSQPFLLKLRD